MFNTGTLIVPSQAEGNPFFTLVEDVRREEEGGLIQMKLDKAKILETEAKLSTFLKELIQMTNNSTNENHLSPNQLLKLVQVARVSAESLLLLGIGLPVGLSDTLIGAACRNREDSIDLEVAVFESNEVLKRNIGLDFNVKS